VALIIDEAQHALTSEAGEAAMTALKSARDQLNQPGVVNLMLVMSGSDRDKLLRLVNTAGAPFYGSQIQRMPPLGPDFIAHIAALIEAQRPELKPVDQALLQQAFEVFGHRPQFFMAALGQVLSPLGPERALRGGPAGGRAAPAGPGRSPDGADYLGLKPTEQAVLWRMLEQGPRFRPYDAEALRFYRDKTGHPERSPGPAGPGSPAPAHAGAGVEIGPGRIRAGRRGHAPLVRKAQPGRPMAPLRPKGCCPWTTTKPAPMRAWRAHR
jgi:hypothetical protein